MTGFVCEVDGRYRSACERLELDFYGEHEDKQYCVLHFPGEEKDKSYFGGVLKIKLKHEDYDFRGVVFPDGTAEFNEREFDKPASFTGATFCNADFRGAKFTRASFSGAEFAGVTHFSKAIFGGSTYFANARFNEESDFREAKFEGELTDFSGVAFCGRMATFTKVSFTSDEVLFSKATFHNRRRTSFAEASFNGEKTSYSQAEFSGERTDFTGAYFSGEWASFIDTKFGGEVTYFSSAQFSGNASFRKANFDHWIEFTEATFEEVSFEDVTFKEVAYFDGATFKREAYFRGLDTFSRVADFQFARIEKPELFSFHSVRLRPSWFVNVDPRKFDFTEVQWPGRPGGPEVTLDDEIRSLQDRNIQPFYNPYTLLSQACRRLSANAEENHEYPLANDFHYWSMDALRKGSWHYRKETWDGLLWIRKNWLRVAKRCGLATTVRLVWSRIRRRRLRRPRSFGLIATLYWASSGYGVSPARASLVLFAIWFMFTAIYFLVVESSPFWVFSASDVGQGIKYARQAAVYSLSALVRLNPRPQSEELDWFQTLVTVEGIIGPLQIALLALAVRRKVMR